MYLQKPEKEFHLSKDESDLTQTENVAVYQQMLSNSPLLPFLLQRITITSILSVLFIIWQPEILWGL